MYERSTANWFKLKKLIKLVFERYYLLGILVCLRNIDVAGKNLQLRNMLHVRL